MVYYPIKKIYIDKAVVDNQTAINVVKKYSDIESEIIEVNESFRKNLSRLSISQGKQTIFITQFNGQFLKPCPGTDKSYRCCNYLIINETTNCPIDCSYCILQTYINNPVITIYTNHKKLLEEIEKIAGLNSPRILRIGTGELTDSLAFDSLPGLTSLLAETITKSPNILLELKSKTNNIDHLLNIDPGKIVFSWSVNPDPIIENEEHKSASLQSRLKAAELAAEKGFLIGFHFDPLLFFPEWEYHYHKLIRQIRKHVNPSRIAWISLGSLRYPADLKEIAQFRFPKTKIFSQELIQGMDGKMRYLKPLRMKMYDSIYKKLLQELGEVFVYFCMESEELWDKILGQSPRDNNEVDWYFAESLYRRFPGLNLPPPKREIYLSPILFPH